MAEIRTKLITDLPLAEVLGGFEIFPVSQFGVAKKTSTLDVINFTKKQDYSTWVYKASSNLATEDISAKYIKLYNDPRTDNLNPEFFIGEAGYHSGTGEVSGLSGFQFYFHEPSDRFVFVSYISSISTGNRNLTAYYLDQNAFMYITNLSTSNTLSAQNIYVTDQVTISANNNNSALFVVQNGQGNALTIFDEINDTTPFVVTASGNVGIKFANPVIDLTIAGSVSASQTLSARNIHVLNRVGIATSNPNETLTVSGNISAKDVIFDGRLNSNRWFETYTNYSAASANEARVATFVNTNSSNTINVNTKVNTTSANWDSVYSHWNVNSGLTFSARTYVTSNSANFSDSITRYNTASGTYATYAYTNQGFLPLSGGTISSGTLRVSGATTFADNVTILGRLCAFNFTVIQAETIPITASTLNVDGSGSFGGAFNVAGEVNLGDDLIVSGFTNVSGTILAAGTITSRQFLQDLNSNSREWGSVYTRWRAVSSLDLNVRSFVNSNSSNIVNVNSKVNTTSANWDSSYSTWNANSSLDLAARSFVNSNSSNIINVNSKVISASSNWDRAYTETSTTSANWNSVYSSWNSNSSLDLNARSFVNSNSSNIVNVNSRVNTTSANWNSVYSHWNVNSGLTFSARTFVTTNSSNSLNVNSKVISASSNWDSVYSHWNVNSGLTFSSRTFVTVNSSNILNVNTKVNQSSANWDSVYGSFLSLSGAIGLGLTTFQSSSARYNRVSTNVEGTSANWNSVYTTFQSNSAKYNSERGVINIPLSGTSVVTVPNHAVGFMDIYLNGIKLVTPEDFTETATTITLSEPTKYNNYKLEYVIYGAYNVANAVARTGDTMTGSLTVPTLNVTNTFSLPTLFLSRQNTSIEGGEIQFARSSDNLTKYHIDVLGSGSDPNLRIFERVGASTMTERVILQGATGNVGIGNSSPNTKVYIIQNHATQAGVVVEKTGGTGDALIVTNSGSGAALKVTNTGSGHAFILEDTNNLKTTPFMVNSTGQILIGTNTAPNNNTSLYIESDNQVGGPNGNILIRRYNNEATNTSPSLTIGKAGGSFLSPQALTVDSHIGAIFYQGLNTGLNFTGAAWVRAEVDSNPTTTSLPGRLTFGTTSQGDAASTEKMRITNSGRVGINTTNPNERLTVVGNISATGNVSFGGILTGDGSGLTRIEGQNRFWKFKANNNDVGDAAVSHRLNSFLTQNGRLYVAGYSYFYINGKRGVGSSPEYVWPGFHPVGNGGIPLDETIVEHYTYPDGFFVKTNKGNLYGMGRNSRGELGFGSAGERQVWSPVINITNVTDFSMSNRLQYYYWTEPYPHALAVSNGRLYSWGNNGLGQLGLGTGSVDPATSPQLVNVGALFNKTNIAWCYAAGDESYNYGHSFAVDTNRKLFACGWNQEGWLGTGNKVRYNEFVAVAPQLNCDKMCSAGWYTNKTSIFLDRQLGKLYGAGMNENGQLGINPTTMRDRSTFAEIPNLSNVVDFAIGGHCNQTGIALLADGTIRTWGANRRGMLGHNGTTNQFVPQVPTNMQGKTFKKVMVADRWWGADYSSIHALDTEGYMWGSGYNGDARLGIGTTTADVGLFTRAHQPNDVRFTDFTVEGFGGGMYVTAVDTYGDLWAVGYHNQHSCGSDRPSMAIGHFTRCDIH